MCADTARALQVQQMYARPGDAGCQTQARARPCVQAGRQQHDMGAQPGRELPCQRPGFCRRRAAPARGGRRHLGAPQRPQRDFEFLEMTCAGNRALTQRAGPLQTLARTKCVPPLALARPPRRTRSDSQSALGHQLDVELISSSLRFYICRARCCSLLRQPRCVAVPRQVWQ